MFLAMTRQAMILLMLSAAAALLCNVFRPEPLPWVQRYSQEKLASIPKEKLLTPAQAIEIHKRGDVLFVDARVEQDFAAGHIPGALNFPFDPFASDLEERLGKLPKNKTLVLYCSSLNCHLAEDLADTLELYDFPKVKILGEGIEAWIDAGGPVKKGAK